MTTAEQHAADDDHDADDQDEQPGPEAVTGDDDDQPDEPSIGDKDV